MSNFFITVEPRKSILIGKLGEPEKIISSIHLMNDLTLLAVGTKKGSLLVFESRNLIENDYKMSNKLFDKK